MVASCIFSCQNYLELPISFHQRRQKDERWPLFCICVENYAILWPSLELLSWPVSGRAKPDNNVLLSDTGGSISDVSVQNVKVDSFRTELISLENYQIFTLLMNIGSMGDLQRRQGWRMNFFLPLFSSLTLRIIEFDPSFHIRLQLERINNDTRCWVVSK